MGQGDTPPHPPLVTCAPPPHALHQLLMGDGVLPAPVVAICSIMRANEVATRGMSSAKAMHMQVGAPRAHLCVCLRARC